jgi:hypothetical protein
LKGEGKPGKKLEEQDGGGGMKRLKTFCPLTHIGRAEEIFYNTLSIWIIQWQRAG